MSVSVSGMDAIDHQRKRRARSPDLLLEAGIMPSDFETPLPAKRACSDHGMQTQQTSCSFDNKEAGCHRLSRHSEEFATTGCERQWLDSDELAIQEMMSSLEQAIGQSNEQHSTEEDSISASSSCMPANYASDSSSDASARSESVCGLNSLGDGNALSIDEKIEQFLQEAEDQNIVLELWDRKDQNVLDILELDNTWDDEAVGAVYDPLLD